MQTARQGLRGLVFTALLASCIWPGRTLAATGNLPTPAAGEPRGSAAVIRHGEDGYGLYRGGRPYEVRGVGGSRFLEIAAAAGANSVRTWGARNAGDVLERAGRCGMTVLLGIWLSHDPADYLSEAYRAEKTAQVRDLLARYRSHPALLMWSLGNEINLQGADTAAAWLFVDQLARLIHREDPDHPVISVVSHAPGTLGNIARYAPHLDAVGINAYGSLPQVWTTVGHSLYRGPYLITEWGVRGHWEAARTSWGRPIEPSSAAKADWMRRHYAGDILAHRSRCLGSYVFLWGQKQERTPTWYSMLLPDLAPSSSAPVTSPSVDVMAHYWRGTWPTNRAPLVETLTLDGDRARDNVVVQAGAPLTAEVLARDPDGDSLTYVWEVLEEPTVLGAGGSWEPEPLRVARIRERRRSILHIEAPQDPGPYRLFVYVLDNQGHVGTANVPFLVDRSEEASPRGQ